MSALKTPSADAPGEEWGRLAVSIPGAPAAWFRRDELILVTGDGQHMSADGSWWTPDENGVLRLDVDHPATEGCLMAMLGPGAWDNVAPGSAHAADGEGWWAWVDGEWSEGLTLGRAAIAAAAAIGRWPGCAS